MKKSEKVANYLSKFFTWILPVNPKIIVFESFIGRQYSDNPRAIYDYIKKYYPQYRCYWSVDKKSADKFPEELEIIKKGTVKWFYIMAKANYWIANSRIPLWVTKPKKTTYIQTWHGTPLKKLALDMDMSTSTLRNPEVYQEEFRQETQRWDYLISPNSYSSAIFKQCFDFKNDMIESGYPRNDYLINCHTIENQTKIKEKLGIPKDKKIVLYAPTWRDGIKFESTLDLKKMQQALGEEYFLLIRLHYLVTEVTGIDGQIDFVKNVTDYPDINDLYLISDLLVTDYSSTFFDYAVLKRPMIFYCFDLEEYKNVLRGFYFDFEKEAPGPIVTTTDEVIQAIQASNRLSVPEEFVERFTQLEDGQATKRVVEKIFK